MQEKAGIKPNSEFMQNSWQICFGDITSSPKLTLPTFYVELVHFFIVLTSASTQIE